MSRVSTSLSLMSKMRGILVSAFGGVEELKLTKDIPVPELGQNQVSVRIHSSGVNPVDTYIRSGTYALKPSLPYIPGKDGAGVVVKVGSNVSNYKVGDRVFCYQTHPHGTLAEFVNVNHTSVFPLSSKLSFDEGASLGISYMTAHRALFIRGKAKAGETILIHGASGGVGMAVIQLAKLVKKDGKGLTVVGTAGTQEGMKRIKALGADAAYCHSDPNYQALLERDHPAGFDIIVEMLANVNLQRDMELMAKGGITVVVGNRGDITVNPRFLMGKESSITGCALGASSEDELKSSSESILHAIEKGFVKPTIGRVFSLEQVPEAHDYIINNSGTEGKVIVKIRD